MMNDDDDDDDDDDDETHEKHNSISVGISFCIILHMLISSDIATTPGPLVCELIQGPGDSICPVAKSRSPQWNPHLDLSKQVIPLTLRFFQLQVRHVPRGHLLGLKQHVYGVPHDVCWSNMG